MYLIFINFVSDHGIMPFEDALIMPRRPIISDNGHLVGHYPLILFCFSHCKGTEPTTQ